jgi:HSP20 family molecular chaperone IbpA
MRLEALVTDLANAVAQDAMPIHTSRPQPAPSIAPSRRALPPPKPAKSISSLRRTTTAPPESVSRTFPTIRLSEDARHITVVAIVPGFSAEELDIAVEGDVLRLTGHRSRQVPASLTVVHKGRRTADFSRTIKLASDILRAETGARLDHGVLTLRMRKCSATDRAPIAVRHH